MPKDKPINPDQEGLKPLPKPIQLNLPSSRSKPTRRLHEPDTSNQPTKKQDKPKPPPSQAAKNRESSDGKRYFDSAQKAYGQRRQRPQKAPKQKRKWWYHTQNGPILGQGDRLYNPPQPKQPFFPPHIWRIVRLWPLGIIVIAIAVMGLINVFSYNAWAVYLDDQLLGHMPINREVEPESIHYEAVRHRQDLLGVDVRVAEVAVVRTVRAGRREIYSAPDMIRRISENFTYQVVASVIYLDGVRVAVLRNQAEAHHVERELMRRFINEGYTLPGSSFEEDWEIKSIPTDVALDAMDSPDEVIQLLERPVQDIFNHVIRHGDTQGALAIEFNTTVNRIGYLNDIPSDAILRVGNILRIEIVRPRLTVRTVDEIAFIETIPRDVYTRLNPNKHVSAPYEEIEAGRDGEVRVVQRITRLNGVQVGAPETIHREELTAVVTRVIEVGTLETVTEGR